MYGDKDLIIRIKNNDESAFVDLYKRMKLIFYRHIRLSGISEQDAEDLVADSIFQLRDKIHHFSTDKSINISKYLEIIAKNRVMDHLQKRKSIESVSILSLDNSDYLSNTDSAEEMEQKRHLLAIALKQLSIHEQYLIRQVIEGKPIQIIAAEMNISPHKLIKQFHYTKQRLKNIISKLLQNE